jgi:hypothetical protein
MSSAKLMKKNTSFQTVIDDENSIFSLATLKGTKIRDIFEKGLLSNIPSPRNFKPFFSDERSLEESVESLLTPNHIEKKTTFSGLSKEELSH